MMAPIIAPNHTLGQCTVTSEVGTSRHFAAMQRLVFYRDELDSGNQSDRHIHEFTAQGRFRFDRIETELWILGLMQFLDANRYPPRIKSGQAFAGKTPWADSTAGAWEFYPRSR
jgi:hypothetical protein